LNAIGLGWQDRAEVSMSDEGRSRSRDASESVVGKWHLLDLAADETHVPHHRVDLVFRADADQLRGAILSRGSGAEIPLASVQFDGDILRLQMHAPKDGQQADMPFLVMHRTNGKFEGSWTPSGKMDRGLKLVRQRH
jgi:hypothetical protein